MVLSNPINELEGLFIMKKFLYIPIMNKYSKWYNSIIQKAKTRNWTKTNSLFYVEKHHIIPNSLGGLNTHDNLVCLTAKEHYICHYICHHLLPKFLEGEARHKMLHALKRLSCGNKETKDLITARMYEWLKKNRKVVSKETCLKIADKLRGNKNGKGNKGRVYDEELRKKCVNINGPWNKGLKFGSYSEERCKNIRLGRKKQILLERIGI